MWKEISKALTLLFVTSASISGAFSLFLDWNVAKFIIGTILAIILQIAGKWFVDYIRTSQQEIAQEEAPLASIKMQIECAYCRAKNIIDYNLTQDEFECESCKNINSIYGKFFAARKNTPLNTAIEQNEAGL